MKLTKIALKIFLVLMMIVFLGCVSSKTFIDTNFPKVFVDKSGNKILHFYEKDFIFLDAFKRGTQVVYADTISYGVWEMIDGRFLELSTPLDLKKQTLSLNVVEKSNSPNDTLCFIIENFFERQFSERQRNYVDLRYTVRVVSNDILLNEYLYHKKYNDNIIKIPIAADFENTLIEIIVFVGEGIVSNHLNTKILYTTPYVIKNSKANVFYIDIPEFNRSKIKFKSLNKDYIRLKTKNRLIWDHEVYIKTE